MTGGDVKPDVFVDHGGKRVHFCCPGCVGTFKKDPDKIIKAMEAQGVVLGEVPGFE